MPSGSQLERKSSKNLGLVWPVRKASPPRSLQHWHTAASVVSQSCAGATKLKKPQPDRILTGAKSRTVHKRWHLEKPALTAAIQAGEHLRVNDSHATLHIKKPQPVSAS